MVNIHEKQIDELMPYENNPRKNDKAVDAVANSIKEFGFKNPIIIDKNNVIVAGHTRLLAAKKLGLKSVPCIIADDLTEEQIKAFRIADNSTAQLADWDLEKLYNEIQTIGLDLADFGLKREIDLIYKKFEMQKVRNAKDSRGRSARGKHIKSAYLSIRRYLATRAT